MEIRSFVEADAEAVLALWESCDLVRPWNDAPRDLREAWTGPSSTILVADQGGAVLASVMVGYDGHRGWIYYLAVHPDRRMQGIGRRMVEASEQWLKARGAPKVQLMVRSENEAAILFYRRIGLQLQPVVTLGKRLDD